METGDLGSACPEEGTSCSSAPAHRYQVGIGLSTFAGLPFFQEKPEIQHLYENPTHLKCWQLVSRILRHVVDQTKLSVGQT